MKKVGALICTVGLLYTPWISGGVMPKGLKATSSLIAISAEVFESAANTFTSQTVDLQLNPLDQEVFVVYGVDIDCLDPNLVPGVDTVLKASVSTTRRTDVGSLGETNVVAINRITIQDNGVTAVRSQFSSDSAPSTQLEYLAIIATNDFFLNIEGTNNLAGRSATARLYGARMTASASIYAALVQSEILSQ